eukprot:TRINITY_DN17876_c0_g1_i1.p1 TRINITY_DN17876_c0_g1~~TRINITY_DN17876_c0_g1_i1.p1  ORF type:complete len:608 (+),score=178.35 TRINITY_DN17876_c0_g1_i1:41-1825(+)
MGGWWRAAAVACAVLSSLPPARVLAAPPPSQAPTASPDSSGSGSGSSAMSGCSSGSGTSMFDAEQDMIQQPWHVFFMFLLVIAISIMHEHLFHWIDHKVQRMHSGSSEKLKAMMQHEVMNLGLIGLWLTFMQEMGVSHEYWSVALFHYTHFILFVMMMVFMVLCGFLLWSMRIVWKTWVRYERFSTMVTDDPDMPAEQKELTLAMYWQRNMNARRITNCLKLYERTVPAEYAAVPFTRYLRKSQRRYLLAMLNLNRNSWLALSLLLFIITLLLHYRPENFRDGYRDMMYFVAAVGYGSLLAVAGVCVKVWKDFRHFCLEIDVISVSFKNVYRGPPPTPQLKRYFWTGKPMFTMQLLQTVLLLQVFYAAIVIVDVVPHVVSGYTSYGWAFCLLALLPTFLIFALCLPVMMPRFCCLASLGEFLSTDLLEDMRKAAATSAIQRGDVNVSDLFGSDGSPRAKSDAGGWLSRDTPAEYKCDAGEGKERAVQVRMRLISDLTAHMASLDATRGADAFRELQLWLSQRSPPTSPANGTRKDWGGEPPVPELCPTKLRATEREMIRLAEEEYQALQKREAERAARLGGRGQTSTDPRPPDC